LTPGTQGLRPGLLSVAPTGLETNETLEPKAALAPFSVRQSRMRRAAPRRLSRPYGALRALTPGTQGLRPGLLSVAPTGLETNETFEPKVALAVFGESLRRPWGAGTRPAACRARRLLLPFPASAHESPSESGVRRDADCGTLNEGRPVTRPRLCGAMCAARRCPRRATGAAPGRNNRATE